MRCAGDAIRRRQRRPQRPQRSIVDLRQHSPVLLPKSFHHSNAHAGCQVEGAYVALAHRDLYEMRGGGVRLGRQAARLGAVCVGRQGRRGRRGRLLHKRHIWADTCMPLLPRPPLSSLARSHKSQVEGP